MSSRMGKPCYVVVRVVPSRVTWLRMFAKDDEERTVLVGNTWTFVLLDPALPPPASSSPIHYMKSHSIVLLKALGQGGQAIVYLAHDLSSSDEPLCAVKHFKRSAGASQSERKRQDLEESLMRRFDALNNPSLVRLRRSFRTARSTYFVMDYHRGGTLYHDVKRNPREYFQNPKMAKSVMLELIDTILFLHSQRIYHW